MGQHADSATCTQGDVPSGNEVVQSGPHALKRAALEACSEAIDARASVIRLRAELARVRDAFVAAQRRDRKARLRLGRAISAAATFEARALPLPGGQS